MQLFTSAEGEIVEINLAVAGLLGLLLLSNLRDKTQRCLKTAVLAGKLAGERAQACRNVQEPDGTNLMMVDRARRGRHVGWTMQEFASGRPSVSSPRTQSAWDVWAAGPPIDASTIHGDPTKQVGIVTPLYRGKLVCNRREWHKSLDCRKRE